MSSAATASGSPATGAAPAGNAAAPAPPPRESLRIGYSTTSGSASPFWVAQEGGFFERQGLDVELLFMAGGSALVNAVIAGDTPYAGLTGLASVNSYLGGGDTIVVTANVNYLSYHLYVRPEIQSAADLRGKALGIARLGSASDFAARYLAQSLGLEVDRDVSLLQVGEQAGRLAALEANQVAGALIESPFTVRARQAGFYSLANTRELGYESLQNGLTTTRRQLDTKPDVTDRVVRALVEGIHYLKTDKASTLAIMARYQQLDAVTEADALEDQYQTYARELIPRLPLVTEQSIRNLLDSGEVTSPRKNDVPIEAYYDNGPLLRLQASGLLRQLYGDDQTGP
jgi:NitT/TauT family transport system substrate-binding protein